MAIEDLKITPLGVVCVLFILFVVFFTVVDDEALARSLAIGAVVCFILILVLGLYRELTRGSKMNRPTYRNANKTWRSASRDVKRKRIR